MAAFEKLQNKVPAKQKLLSPSGNILFFSYKNIVFLAQAEYS